MARDQFNPGMNQSHECPFCNLKAARIWSENTVALAFYDGFPVTDGHTVIIPKKHVVSIFDLSLDDQKTVWALVVEARERLAKKYLTADFNIGINDGKLAGQTVPHAHIHVIPRRDGDADDPRGGIRWIIPGKAKYW